MDPFGWRIVSALAGTLAVTGLALMAQLLFGRPTWTFIAGLLLALEHLSVVLSRLALLDVPQLWIVAGFLCLVLDRRWIELRNAAPASRRRRPVPALAPLALRGRVRVRRRGLVKWSGGLGMVAAIVISLMWETTRRRTTCTRGAAFGRALLQESFA